MFSADAPAEPSLVLILKWGGELTPAGRIQAEELGRIFRCMYPGGQGRHLAGSYSNFTTFINFNTNSALRNKTQLLSMKHHHGFVIEMYYSRYRYV